MSQQSAAQRDDEIDPDGDPAMLPSPPDTSGTPPTDVSDTLTVQEDPEDHDDPDGDPENLTSKRHQV